MDHFQYHKGFSDSSDIFVCTQNTVVQNYIAKLYVGDGRQLMICADIHVLINLHSRNQSRGKNLSSD